MRSEYSHHGVSTSSGVAGLDPSTARPLSVDERSGIKVTDEPLTTRERLRAAREALKRAETAKRVAIDLVEFLETELKG